MSRTASRANGIAGALVTASAIVLGLAAGCGGSSTEPTQLPDRIEIVYSLDPGGTPSERNLYVINSDGTSNQPLLALPGDEAVPSWSPDGRKVAFQHIENGTPGLWWANEDGSSPTRIPTVDYGWPRWSPDGKEIIFAATGDAGPEIVAMRLDGSGRRSLTAGISGVMLSPPAWSSTGRIAFMRSSGGNTGSGNIWVMNADGTGLAQVTQGPFEDQIPVWSPDGSMLAYTEWAPVAGLSGYAAQVVVVNADGSGKRVLTGADGSTNNLVAAWSPDGQWLLYLTHASENGLYGCWFEKIPVGGGAAVRLAPQAGGAECGSASWRSRRP